MFAHEQISQDHRPDRGAARQGRACRRRSCRRRGRRTRSSTILHEQFGDEFRERQADHRQGTTAPTPIKELRERIVAELLPEDGEAKYTPAQVSRRLRRPRGAGRPRADPRRQAHRRPRPQATSGRSTARSASCRATHGSALFQRGETQALVTTVLGTASRRAAGRRDHGRVQQEVHARLQLAALHRRRGPARSAAPAAARSATAPWPSAASRPILPDARQVPLHDPRRLRHPRIQRLQLAWPRSAAAPWPDGRRRADQRPGRAASRSAWSRRGDQLTSC